MSNFEGQIKGAERFANCQVNIFEEYVENLKSLKTDQEPSQIINLIQEVQQTPNQNSNAPTKEQINILQENLGKIDGYTNMSGIPEIRNFLKDEFNQKNEKLQITENDIFVTFGLQTAFWLVQSTLLEKDDQILIPEVFQPFLKNIIHSRQAKPIYYENNITHLISQMNQHQKNMQSIVIQNPLFMNSQQQINDEKAKQILTIAQQNVIPLILYGDSEVFLKNNQEIKANLIIISELNNQLKGWNASNIILVGNAFEQVKKGFSNLLDVILMTNTLVQSSYVQLHKSENLKTDSNDDLFKEIKGYRQESQNGIIDLSQLSKTQEPVNDVQVCQQFYEKYAIITSPGSFYGLQTASMVFNNFANRDLLQKFAQKFKEEFQL